jgi:acetate kinase
MKNLCINLGSSSAKYSYFYIKNKQKYRINIHFQHDKHTSKIQINHDDVEPPINKKIKKQSTEKNLEYVLEYLKELKHIVSIKDITQFYVRLVHGGNIFTKATTLTQRNLIKLKNIQELAPLHNPYSYNIVLHIFKINIQANIKIICDTSFHSSIPEHISVYALPQVWTKKWGLKKYGFHGIALESIMHQIKNTYTPIPKKIIACHLGGGCSITAILNGKSYDTSMGFSPLEGLMMLSRSGSVDPGLIEYLMKKTQKSYHDIVNILYKKSGFYGLTKSHNMQNIIQKAKDGKAPFTLAIEMFCYQIIKYIYSYYGSLQGIDCFVFSGGIGEGSSYIRTKIIDALALMNLHMDSNKNQEFFGHLKEIQTSSSQNKILIISPDENLEMAK